MFRENGQDRKDRKVLRKMQESYCTTSQFAKIGDGYKRHCGPTAISNLLLTLKPELAEEEDCGAEKVFKHVALIGKRRMSYVNADVLGRFGGTSDLLARLYLPACLKAFHIRNHKVRGPYLFSKGRMRRELDEGRILYLEVHRHPKYGGHHLICYGYKMDAQDEMLLKVADGWKAEPVYMPASECRLGCFLTVQ